MTSDDRRLSCTNAGLMPQGESRRVFLLGAAGASLAGGLIATARRVAAAESAEAAPLFAYIGCFTSDQRKAHSKGISVYRIDANGSWSLVQMLETLPNPQFIAFDRQQKFLYSVHGDGTEVSSYAIDKTSGRISFLNKQPTSGNNSTHLTPDPTNRYIVIGNGIRVAVFPINPDGSLAPYTDMVRAGGDVGPHRNQVGPGPHPHYVGFDPSGRFLLAPDRGTDRTHTYRLDLASGKLVPNNPAFARSRPGAGPRHLAFHPAKPWGYVCDELDSTVTAYTWDSERGELNPLQVITTLPEDYVGGNTTAEIQFAPSGRTSTSRTAATTASRSSASIKRAESSVRLAGNRRAAAPRASSVSIRPGACSTRPISTATTSWPSRWIPKPAGSPPLARSWRREVPPASSSPAREKSQPG
jgi:6-phosphogluconolactonase